MEISELTLPLTEMRTQVTGVSDHLASWGQLRAEALRRLPDEYYRLIPSMVKIHALEARIIDFCELITGKDPPSNYWLTAEAFFQKYTDIRLKVLLALLRKIGNNQDEIERSNAGFETFQNRTHENIQEWLDDVNKLTEWIDMSLDFLRYLHQTASLRQKGSAPPATPLNNWSVHMGDQYTTTGPAGIVGPNATGNTVNFRQIGNQVQGSSNIGALSEELGRLRNAMTSEAKESDHHLAVGAVAAAEAAAKSGDGPKAMEYFQKAGSWAVDIATKIGIDIASSALKTSLSLGE